VVSVICGTRGISFPRCTWSYAPGGKGVPVDYKIAHMWLNNLAVNGYEDSGEGRDDLAKLMSPGDINEAQEVAREWVKNHPQL
jgi:hypothetical protein